MGYGEEVKGGEKGMNGSGKVVMMCLFKALLVYCRHSSHQYPLAGRAMVFGEDIGY